MFCILQRLGDRVVTLDQGIALHGNFPTPHVPAGIPRNKVGLLYRRLVVDGCLAMDGDRYRVTLQARNRMEKTLTPPAAAVIVPPFQRNVWTPPLKGYAESLRERPCR